MAPPLAERMAPVVNDSLAEVGAIQSYDEMMGQYKTVPFVPDAKADLTDDVVEKGMDGLFHYVAQEEAAIRKIRPNARPKSCNACSAPTERGAARLGRHDMSDTGDFKARDGTVMYGRPRCCKGKTDLNRR